MNNDLAGFDEAPVYNRLPMVEAGNYVAEILTLRRFYSKEKDKDYFAAEFRILEAAPGSGSPVGAECVELLPLSGQYKATFYGKAKQIIGAATGEDARQVTKEDFDEATADDNPCKGYK